MRAAFIAAAAAAILAMTPALGAENVSKPQRKQAQCGAVWKAHKAELAPVYGSWARYWSACAAALKAGTDPVSAPVKPRGACTTDSDCAKRAGGNGDPRPAS